MGKNRISGLNLSRTVFIASFLGVLVCLAVLTYLRNGDYRTIKTLWTSAVKVDPQNPRAYLSLGVAALEENRLSDAEGYLVRSMELSHPGRDTRQEALLNLGYVYFARGNPVKALEQFESLLSVNPVHVQALYNASVVSLQAIKDRSRRLDRASSYQARLERVLSPSHPRALGLKAIIINESQGAEAAATLLQSSGAGASQDPAIQDAWEQILVGFMELQADDGQALRRLLSKVPSAQVVIRSVRRLAGTGSHRHAILLTDQAYRVRPDFSRALLEDPVTSALLPLSRN